MIESVAVRQQGAYDFETHYNNLCALQSTCPSPAVKAHLSEGVLDVNGDRIRVTDWAPILNSIRINKTLTFIGIRSYFQSNDDDDKRVGVRKKTPGIRSKEITYRLCKSLKECLSVTPVLTCIELQGLPLRERDLSSLSKGLTANATLTHLSLEYSAIGDEGLDVICKGVKNSPSVTSLNFTGCGLSWKGAGVLATVIKVSALNRHTDKVDQEDVELSDEEPTFGGDNWPTNSTPKPKSESLIDAHDASVSRRERRTDPDFVPDEHQAMKRHNEAWQDSLRYRRPDLDRMSGIRRITVNSNPMMAEKGALALAEALKDDLWLKALDMQQCGLNNTGAQALLDVLKYNTTIVVLDVRQNPLIEQDIIRSIMEQVMINCNGQDTEYKWIRADSQSASGGKGASKTKKKRTRTLQSSFGKKTTIKVTTSNPRRRSKSTTSVSRAMQPFGSEVVKPGPGMPWRTALRADRYRKGQDELKVRRSFPGKQLSNHQMQKLSSKKGYHPDHDKASKYERLSTSPESPSRADCSGGGGGGGYTSGDMSDPADITDSADYTVSKQTMIEMEQLRRRYREESIARSRADAQVLELQVENQRMRHQVEVLQAGGVSTSMLDDEKVLENIEKSFQQFHSFLDMLQEAGLGQLITLAGLDQSRLPFSRSDLQAARGPSPSSAASRQGAAPASGKPADLGPQHPGGSSAPSGASVVPPNKINLVPQNRRHGDDPTLHHGGTSEPLSSSSGHRGKTRFDDLYAKVLQETDGAISNAQAEADLHSATSAGRVSPPEVKDPVSERSTGGNSAHHPGTTSQRSQASRHSSRSQGSASTARPALQQTSDNVLNSQASQHSRSGGSHHPHHSLKGAPPAKSPMASEVHEYSQDFDPTQSDISEDIENIQDINDLLPASEAGFGGDDDSF